MDKQPVSLAGRVAVITGSTRGIGRTIAERFGAAGARVVVASSQAEAVAQTVADLRASGVTASGLACDVSDRARSRRCSSTRWTPIGRLIFGLITPRSPAPSPIRLICRPARGSA